MAARLIEVDVELKQPRVIDPLVADSASGEPIENGGALGRFRFSDGTASVWSNGRVGQGRNCRHVEREESLRAVERQ